MQISKDNTDLLRANIVLEIVASRGEDEAASDWIRRDEYGDIIHSTDMVKLTPEAFQNGSIKREYVGLECPIRRGRTHFDAEAGDWIVEVIIPDSNVVYDMKSVPTQLDDGTWVLVEKRDTSSKYVPVFASELEVLDGAELSQPDKDFRRIVRQRLSTKKDAMRKAAPKKRGGKRKMAKNATVVGTLMSMPHDGKLLVFRHGHKEPEIKLPADAFKVRDAYLEAFGTKVPTGDEIDAFKAEHLDA